jgi:hypothetical protein
MRGKRVRFSFPPFLRIRDYSLGYRTTVPYNPELCLHHLRRFRDVTSNSCIVLSNDSTPICLNIPLGQQGIHEGDAIRIVPLM